MPFTVVRTEEVTPEELQRFQQDEEDYEWLSAHAHEIEGHYKGKFIAVVNRLQQSYPLGAKGFTKAGIRKMVARLHEELALYEGSQEVRQAESS